jgi:hypothetical protein
LNTVNAVNTWNLIPVLLLALLGAAFALGAAMVLLVVRTRNRRARFRRPPARPAPLFDNLPPPPVFTYRPSAWLAIRSRNLHAVQAALGLHNAKPCTWTEGLASEQKLFIAPPVNGWILVMGTGLPDPAEDVDECFRFLLDLSRQLGQVQFFSADPVLDHHAWVRLEAGRVVRAYAWAGKTIWNQGVKTRAELQLGLKCFRYLETPERISFAQPDLNAMNTEKVPLLAAEWSLDPASIDERVLDCAFGIAGEPARNL